jgi:uncharacterized protein YcbK (DUF882 family)
MLRKAEPAPARVPRGIPAVAGTSPSDSHGTPLEVRVDIMTRSMSINLLGVLGLLVGLPLAITRGADRFPLLRRLRPTVSLSMVRSGEPVPVLAADVPPLASDAIVPPEHKRLVIEPLPAPGVAVSLENINTEETATFDIGPTGQVRPEQVTPVKHFFRCRRTDREKPIAPATLAILAEIAHRWPGHTIQIVSGFRAPPFGAPHSKHFAGHAIDLRVRGVRSAAVRDFVWREHHGVGVGYYTAENFVHIDSRPGEPDVAWTGQGEDGVNSYAPRWAYRARHPRSSRVHPRSPLASVTSSTRSL